MFVEGRWGRSDDERKGYCLRKRERWQCGVVVGKRRTARWSEGGSDQEKMIRWVAILMEESENASHQATILA